MPKQILSGQEVLPTLLRGVNLISDAVKASLGPSGRNCVYERLGTGLPISSRDGVTIAEQIEALDPFEAIGVNLIKGVAREAVDQSGDGTTTATLLAQAIFSEGVKAVSVGANPVALKRGIEAATAAVLAALRDMAIPVSGSMLRAVATISANNDPFLGGLIADAISSAGPDGVVTVEVSQTPESSLKVVEGMQLGTGYLSPHFVTDRERQECVLEDCFIYLHESKMATVLPMSKVLEQIIKDGHSVLVIAEDVTDEALGVLAANALKGIKFCAIRTPGGVEHLHDIAALTGARVHTDLLGVRLEHVTQQFFGRAKKVIVKPQSTTIISHGESPKLEARLKELRQQVTDATDEGQRLRLQSRLARLSGGVVVIKVGALTELEMNERKDRIEDALHATRCAEREGVVIGGGMALYRAAFQSSPIYNLSNDEAIGANIIKKVCEAPLRTLAHNSGKSAEYVIEKVWKDREFKNGGWNARTDEFCDLMEAGIIDPLRVVRVALESAASVAALMLITATLVSNGVQK